MELRALRYFVAVAEEGSFTGAADRLWIAQPGLSTQVRRLEIELGIKLLHRHARGVELTAAGTAFLDRARAVMRAVAEASAAGRDLADGVVGSLNVGVDSSLRWRRTPELLEGFASERPGVEVGVTDGYSGMLWRDLREGRLDAIVAPSYCRSVDLTALKLGQEPWAALVGARHRLAGTGPLDPAELEGERVAATAHRDGAPYDDAVTALLAEIGVDAIPTRTTLGAGSQSAVARGDLIVLTTAPRVLDPGVTFRPLRHSDTVELQLICRREDPTAPLAAFLRRAESCAVGHRRNQTALVAA